MPSERAFSLAAVRTAARKHAEATSLRTAAADIGMSFTGFRAFLAGGKPQPKTRTKLALWYAQARAARGRKTAGVTAADADLAATVLALYVKQDGRQHIRDRRLLEAVARIADEGAVSEGLRDRLAEWAAS